MRVLVTGAAGFLGTRVVRRLVAEGHAVTAMGRSREGSPFAPEVRYVRADLSASPGAVLGSWEWDAVVNLAGPVPHAYPRWSDGAALVAEHTRIAANVRMWAPPSFRGRFIHTSSMTVYGMPDEVDVREDHLRRPMHPYGMAKVAAEEAFLAGPPADRWVLRFGGLFCPSRRGGALFHFMKGAREGKTLMVDAGTPTPWNILHVEDAALAIARCLVARAEDAGPVNISYGEPIEITDVARRIAARTGVGVERKGSAEHPPMNLAIDKARGLFDWPPATLDARLDELWMAWDPAGPKA